MRVRIWGKHTVTTHIPEHPVVTIYGILYTLLGECLTLDFWGIWKTPGSKEVIVRDEVYNADFKLKYIHGRQSEVLNELTTYSFKVSGSQTYSSDLTTAVRKVSKNIESYESSFLIISQLPVGSGVQLVKGVGSKCVYNSYRVPDLTKVNLLANELDVEKVVVKDYYEEVYVAGLDKLFLIFIYWRTLTTPPKPQFTELRV